MFVDPPRTTLLDQNRKVPILSALIDAQGRAHERALELELFGTTDSHSIAELLEDLVAARLGPTSEAIFYTTSVGVVAGLRLASGGGVVVKVHRWGVTAERLKNVQQIQVFVVRAGLPAPMPLLEPVALGAGFATIEEMLEGERADAHSRIVRKAVAEGLYNFIDAARPLRRRVDVGVPLALQDWGPATWPEPHDLRFDFDVTSLGAERIDKLAQEARWRLRNVGPEGVIGHFDWRVGNLGFAGSRIAAIYDWDSLACAPEPVVVGCAAAVFSASWTAPESGALPSLEEMRDFVRDYEFVRGNPFAADELSMLDAANLWMCAYGARCQHSDESLSRIPVTESPASWKRLLDERGERAF
jgi:hypothetical protein